MRSSWILAIAFALLSSAGLAQSRLSLPPTAAVDGKSQREWSTLWWQWAASFSRSDSPVADRTGEFCHLKQSGSVWFLAGTYGTARTVRTCKVPKGKYLFFPLLNFAIFPNNRACEHCCPDYVQQAKQMTDSPSDLIVEVDGRRVEQLQKYRQSSPGCFDLGTRATPPFHVFPTAGDGYYVMLKPLPPGKHVLNFGGRLPTMSQAVTYTLYVE
jgi:hypothetical protein